MVCFSTNIENVRFCKLFIIADRKQEKVGKSVPTNIFHQISTPSFLCYNNNLSIVNDKNKQFNSKIFTPPIGFLS